jgi:hypothetical protein
MIDRLAKQSKGEGETEARVRGRRSVSCGVAAVPEGGKGTRETHDTRFDSTLTASTFRKLRVQYTMGSPVYKEAITAWPAFRVWETVSI